MISIPINKSFSQISVVSSKLAPDKKDEGRKRKRRRRIEREREKRKWEKLERVFRRLLPGRRRIVFLKRRQE